MSVHDWSRIRAGKFHHFGAAPTPRKRGPERSGTPNPEPGNAFSDVGSRWLLTTTRTFRICPSSKGGSVPPRVPLKKT